MGMLLILLAGNLSNESVMFIQLSVPFSEVFPGRLFRRHHTINDDDTETVTPSTAARVLVLL